MYFIVVGVRFSSIALIEADFVNSILIQKKVNKQKQKYIVLRSIDGKFCDTASLGKSLDRIKFGAIV